MTTLTLARDELSAAVTFAARALPRNAPHPVLNGLRITAADGQVTVSAFDYDTYAEARAGGSPETCDLLLPGKAFASYLAGMTSATVTIDVRDTQAEITCGSARVALTLLSLEDYPAAPPVPASIGTLDGDTLATVLTRARETIDPNDPVTALRALLADIDGTFTLAGGSRYVFALREVDWDGDGQHSLLLPLTVADAAKTLSGPVAFGADDSRVALSTDDRCLVVRLLAGEAMKYRRLFDAHSTVTAVTVDRDELAAALKWVAAGDTRKETFGQIVMAVDPDGITVSLREVDGLDASTTVEAKVDGEDLTTGWKTLFLLQGLNGTSASTVTLNFGGATKPMRISAEADPTFAALVMPVKLP